MEMSRDQIIETIKRSIPGITSEIKNIYSRIKERRSWLPPSSVEPQTRQHYQNLNIPLLNNNPSLLLHGLLGASPSRYAKDLFRGSRLQ